MKTRIASSIALAAAIALGATGCGLAAPQATTDPYAPSDGVEASLNGVDVRNLLLVAAEDGSHFNVVFTGVNSGSAPVQLSLAFVSKNGAAEATADFVLEPGLQAFGDPDGDADVVAVELNNVNAGDTVTAYVQVTGSPDQEVSVPVLDGTLVEYQQYVLTKSFTKKSADAAGTEVSGTDATSESGATSETE